MQRPYGERDEGRVNSRNGYRERGLSTAAGDVTLKIPKLRRGSFFPEDLIERYCRVDRALVAAVAEMYVMGISTRKVEAVAGELGVRSMSKSQVSRLCECLDARWTRSGGSASTGCASPTCGSTHLREVPRGGALGVPGRRDRDRARRHGPQALRRRGLRGHGEPRRVEGVPLRLRARGVDGVRLVVSDAHEGLAKAIAETFQGAAWQRCVTHLMRNVAGRIHRKDDQRKAREAMKPSSRRRAPSSCGRATKRRPRRC